MLGQERSLPWDSSENPAMNCFATICVCTMSAPCRHHQKLRSSAVGMRILATRLVPIIRRMIITPVGASLEVVAVV